jgi:nuclear pore complex protein Nup93
VLGNHYLQPTSNFLLAQAQINAPTLSSQIASLNTQTTFQPLQPLSDTDIPNFLRHAHEQSLISAIEEGRRETENEFYRVLEERVRRDWESRKKKIFEELGAATSTNPGERDASDNAFGRSKIGALGLNASTRGKLLGSTVRSS